MVWYFFYLVFGGVMVKWWDVLSYVQVVSFGSDVGCYYKDVDKNCGSDVEFRMLLKGGKDVECRYLNVINYDLDVVNCCQDVDIVGCLQVVKYDSDMVNCTAQTDYVNPNRTFI